MNFEDKLKEEIKKNPGDPMNYYYLAKEIMKKPLKDIESLTIIENLFKKSLELGPHLWAPKIMLGELLYKMGRFNEAEPYFKETLNKKVPNSSSIKEYLAKCVSKNSNHGEDWWRKGVPPKVRAKCASRREEGLDEEREADLLFFADFYDYRIIIESNKTIFSSYIDTKDWCKKLEDMEPIRNAIAHNRPLKNAPVRVKDYHASFQKIIEKVKGRFE